MKISTYEKLKASKKTYISSTEKMKLRKHIKQNKENNFYTELWEKRFFNSYLFK